MDKKKILEYINNTPENTNPAIISSMLDGYSSAEKYTGKTTGLSEGSGDVTISYKGTVLGNLSNSGTAVLETKDTICEDDIEIEYTKAPSGANTPKTFSATLPDNFFEAINDTSMRGATVFIDDGNICQTSINLATHYIPANIRGGIQFVIDIKIGSDMYNVSINNQNVDYRNGEYWCEVTADNISAMPNITLVVTEKTT